MRDLKSNNAEEKYLKGLDKKIDLQEKRMIASELGGALFVVPAGMILKLGIGTVALVGGMLLANNAITVLTFFMYLLVVFEVVLSFEFVAAKPRRHHLHEHSHRTNERN